MGSIAQTKAQASHGIDPDTWEKIRSMCRYIADDGYIARYIGVDPVFVERIRSRVPQRKYMPGQVRDRASLEADARAAGSLMEQIASVAGDYLIRMDLRRSEAALEFAIRMDPEDLDDAEQGEWLCTMFGVAAIESHEIIKLARWAHKREGRA